MDYPDLSVHGHGMMGTIGAHLVDDRDTTPQRSALNESANNNNDDECESLNQNSSSLKEDEKSVGKDNKDYDETLSSNFTHHFKPLTILEKRFLLAVERGDMPAVKRYKNFVCFIFFIAT